MIARTPQSRAWRACLRQEVWLGNYSQVHLSLVHPCTQAPSSPGTHLVQGLLLGAESEARPSNRAGPGSGVGPERPRLEDSALKPLHPGPWASPVLLRLGPEYQFGPASGLGHLESPHYFLAWGRNWDPGAGRAIPKSVCFTCACMCACVFHMCVGVCASLISHPNILPLRPVLPGLFQADFPPSPPCIVDSGRSG